MAADASIVARIGGDATGLVGALDRAKGAVRQFGDGVGSIADGIARKFEFRDIARTLSTALGLSLTSIADKVARFFIGFSKAQEEALENLVKTTDKAADAQEKRLDKARDEALKKEDARAQLLIEQGRLVWEARMQYFQNEKEEREKAAKDEKQKAKEAAEDDLAWYKERVRLDDRLRTLKLEALDPAEREAALQKDITGWQAQQAKLDKDSNEWKALETKILEANLSIEEKITAEKERQRIAAEKAAKIEIAAQSAKSLGIKGGLTADELAQLDEYVRSEGKKGKLPTRTGGQLATSSAFSNESDETLQQIIQQAKKELFKLSSAFGVFGIGADLRKMQIQSTLGAAQSEVNARRKLSMDYALGGETLARQNFAGSPMAFERFFEQIIKGQTVAEKSLQTLEEIDRRLKAGIPMIQIGTASG
jgi:hypothetical protein